MMILKIILLGFLTLGFLGCSVTTPSITEYKIQYKAPQAEFHSTGCKTKILKVHRAFSPNALMSQHMYYVLGAHKQYGYTQARWAEAPNKFITVALATRVRESGVFERVVDSSSRAQGDWILEANIQEFLQYFQEDGSGGYVKVTIHFTLIDPKSNAALDAKTLSVELPCASDDAQGGVEALQKALEEILTQNILWLEEVCE